MPDIVLIAEPRSERGSRPAGRLRREGKVPAVVYGLGNDVLPVSVPARELAHILAGESGANTLINLEFDGDAMLTLARQIQRHPTRGDLVHVDFIRIRRDVAVSADVPLHLVGEPEGVRDGGLLEQLVFTVTVEAMPGNIPVSLELDVGELAIGDQRRMSDLTLPADVTSHLDPETVVAQVAAPRVVVEEELAGEAAEGEEGEGAEGAPAAEASSERASEGDGGE
ncbi:MAG TPA: 50S ribosomal protein L25 [Acidimicrobiia bacterium]|jgi:large subunit ribosomal protein L25